MKKTWLGAAVLSMALSGCGGNDTGPEEGQTPGGERRPTTAALETGAALLQAKAPVEQISMYMVGFHPSKGDPQMQMESHHYCDQVDEDFAQCALYDGNTKGARLHGVEYIISEKLYATLPPGERPYWHPHNYEILSGELRLPGVPGAAEAETLRRKLNSYGKTWHFWKTGVYGEASDPLPLGPPHLAWSFNRDGEMKSGMLEARDRRMELDTTAARKERSGWAALARPQAGVDVLAGKLPGKGAPEGVKDSGEAGVAPIPAVVMREE